MVDHLRAGAVALLADLARGRAGGVDAVVVATALDQALASDAAGLLGAVSLRLARRLAHPADALPVIRAVQLGVARFCADSAVAVRMDRDEALELALARIRAGLPDLLLRASEQDSHDSDGSRDP